ncbi:hypothetical protein STEG23_013256 [Scotinomys teguina]
MASLTQMPRMKATESQKSVKTEQSILALPSRLITLERTEKWSHAWKKRLASSLEFQHGTWMYYKLLAKLRIPESIPERGDSTSGHPDSTLRNLGQEISLLGFGCPVAYSDPDGKQCESVDRRKIVYYVTFYTTTLKNHKMNPHLKRDEITAACSTQITAMNAMGCVWSGRSCHGMCLEWTELPWDVSGVDGAAMGYVWSGPSCHGMCLEWTKLPWEAEEEQ